MDIGAIEGELNEALLQKMIQLSNRENEKKEKFQKQLFADDEQDLVQKLPNLKSSDPHSLEWIGLTGQLKQLMSDGAESNSVQRIIKRMMEKSKEEYPDDESFLEKMWAIRKSPSLSNQVGLYPLDEDFLDFIEQACTIYEVRNRG